jgi:hypothetical protein
MEPMEPRDCNRWRPVANGQPRKPEKTRQNLGDIEDEGVAEFLHTGRGEDEASSVFSE